MKVNEAGKMPQKYFTSFLSDKPMWAFWIAYTVICGVLYGIFYTLPRIHPWWLPIAVIIPVGMIWGTFVFKKQLNEKKLADE